MQVCFDEEQARKKWCPFARTVAFESQTDVSESAGTFNRPWEVEEGGAKTDCLCIASDCMAWRWAMTNINDGEGGLTPSGDTHGYCGLTRGPGK